jgi:hypothetical protein
MPSGDGPIMEPAERQGKEVTDEDLDKARFDLVKEGLAIPDDDGEIPPSVEFDAADEAAMEQLMDSLNFHVPTPRGRYRRHVRTERRRYTRELRGVERWDETAFSFIPPLPAEGFSAMRELGLLGPWLPDPKGYRLPESKRVPWPFEPQVEAWEDEAVIPLSLGRELSPDEEVWARQVAIEEPRGGGAGGCDPYGLPRRRRVARGVARANGPASRAAPHRPLALAQRP